MVKEVCMEKMLSDATENFTTGFMCSESVLEVLNRVKRILKRTGHIILNIIGAGSCVVSHYHDSIGIYIRIQVDRQLEE